MNAGVLILIALALTATSYAQKYQTLGPSGCGVGQNNCHAGENANMVDGHKNSAINIADAENSQKYADALGVKEFLKDKKCMDCHGTTISGREGKEVEEGVSCESCHGPGSGYKDPHSEGPKGSEGLPRPAYLKSVALGLADLKKPEETARSCVRCHYTTDQKLLAAGHPDGAKFAYVSKMKSVVKHWKYRDKGSIPDQQVFKAAVAKKGPGAKLPPAQPIVQQTSGPQTQKAAAQTQKQQIEEPKRSVAPPPPPTPPPASEIPVAVGSKSPIVLPPFPTITKDTRIDSILLIVKKRLELLYQVTGN